MLSHIGYYMMLSRECFHYVLSWTCELFESLCRTIIVLLIPLYTVVASVAYISHTHNFSRLYTLYLL